MSWLSTTLRDTKDLVEKADELVNQLISLDTSELVPDSRASRNTAGYLSFVAESLAQTAKQIATAKGENG